MRARLVRPLPACEHVLRVTFWLTLLPSPFGAEDAAAVDATGGVCAAPGAFDAEAGVEGASNGDDEALLQLQGSRDRRGVKRAAAGQPRLGGSGRPERPTLQARVLPIQQDQSEFPNPRREAKVAWTFSGGGSRSLSSSVGVLRGLHTIGAPRPDAISSVSGGTWALSQYMFAKQLKSRGGSGKSSNDGHMLTDMDLLGKPTSPKELNMVFLNQVSGYIARTANVSSNAVATRLIATDFFKCNLRRNPLAKSTCLVRQAHELFDEIVGHIFLDPYGLDTVSYMASSDAAVREIKQRNPRLGRASFTTPRQGRPATFVMNGVLESPLGYIGTGANTVSFQMSPDYTGSPFYPNNSKVTFARTRHRSSPFDYLGKCNVTQRDEVTLQVGGGQIETFAFGGEAPSPQDGNNGHLTDVPAPAAPFRLAKAVAISSQAASEAMTQANIEQMLNPVDRYWPVTRTSQQTQAAETFNMGDGGVVDNTGIPAMLQSGVRKIAVFLEDEDILNTSFTSSGLCNLSANMDLTYASGSDLSALFGWTSRGDAWNYMHEQVFSKEDFPPLLCELGKLKDAGKAAIAAQTLVVQRNTWWGIPGGSTVEVLWSYLDTAKDFEAQLPADTRAELAKGPSGQFRRYPHYHTTFQNPPQVSSYYTCQINLLSAQMEWAVRQNRQVYCDFLGGCSGGWLP